ncbi:tol-pal system protein YbgF [uncultured Cohaesibacter sp.]|uniref:tol-pal system protein YbgF n=1 Tax=uncultured Cohaesibacter sp. TaxID=1002546 RepID=UPI0029C8E025|nr:tol-pal system protein YbgF [uncultured Cohaesibacter sp.]
MNRFLVTAVALIVGGNGAVLASSNNSWNALSGRVNALETQVVDHGVPLPPMPIDETAKPMQVAQSAADLAVRVDRLEEQMRQYNGQIEELNFRVRQLQEQLQRFQEDSEFRFRDLEGGKTPRQSSSNLSAPANPAPQQFEQLGSPPQNLGTLSGNQAPQDSDFASPNLIGQAPGGSNNGAAPIDLSSMLNGGGNPPAASNGGYSGGASGGLTGDPAADYDVAYGYMLQSDYVAAEGAFEQFVGAYGQDRRAPDGYYWLGEAKFQQGKYRDAIQVFLDAYSKFPNSQKAPDMLLRTGMSLRQINERDAACATYEELLQKFPTASPAILQRVRAEIQSAKC